MVSQGRIAAASHVATPEGPVAAHRLCPGMEIWGVSRSGELAPAVVASCDPVSAPVELVRVLTRVGDVLAVASSQLAGAQGPVSADGIRPGPRALELLSPGDVPRATGRPLPLEGVGATVAVIPEETSNPAALAAVLRRGGMPHEFVANGGWLAVRIGCCDEPPEGWEWDDELELLLALTMWVPDVGVPIHRTRLSDRTLRARLVGTLLACGRNFELRWVPAYLPLEAHVALTDVAPPAFTGVVAVHHTMGEALDLRVHGATAAVVDLVYLRLHRMEA